jgi:hypothetical protein
MSTGTILDSLLSILPADVASNVDLEQWRSSVSNQNPNFAQRPPVPNSEDLERIIALPRRPQVDLDPTNPVAPALVQIMNDRLRRPDWERRDCKCASYGRHCITTLQPSQAWALFEAPLVGGVLGSIRAGGGKTALNFLLPMVMGCRQVVLLIPPKLKVQLIAEHELWREHWMLPTLIYDTHKSTPMIKGRPIVHVIPYSQLSRPESTRLLKDRNPDLVLADEMHKISSRGSARAARFLRFFAENARTARFGGYTGTITDKSINEYAHLSTLALREGSPVPIDPPTAASWALAIDPGPRPAEPGALRLLCEDGESLESGFRRRLVETRGVIATREGLIGSASLNIFEYAPAPEVPEEVQRFLAMVRSGERPDGEELVDPLEVAKNARELASGFYYRWRFPNLPRNADGEVTEEGRARVALWRARRKAWRSELRDKLSAQEEHLDSQKLCIEAVHRAYQDPPYQGDLPVWRAKLYLPWAEIEHTVEHETEAVWVDDFWAIECAKWAREHKGIVWYEHDALAQRIHKLSGLPVHSGGNDAEARIRAEKGDRSIIASIKSHGEGRDGLQLIFHEQLIANPMSSGKKWEQCLDDKTEILTREGWIGIDTPPTASTQFAAFDIANETIHWSQGTRIERLLGDEQMYGISAPALDIRVTAGHRMIHRRKEFGSKYEYDEQYSFHAASELPVFGRVPVAGFEQTQGVPLTDDELIFIGLFMTDGNLSRGNNAISLFQSDRYPDIIRLIQDTLKACNFRNHHSVHSRPSNFGPRRYPMNRWAISYGMPRKKSERHMTDWARLEPYVDKELSPLLEKCTKQQLHKLLHGMWAGDGSKVLSHEYTHRYNDKTITIGTRRKIAADRIQALCVRRGLRCNVSQRVSDGMYVMHISEDVSWTVRHPTRPLQQNDRPVWGVLPSLPDERVWCVTVDSGAIVTRRNGKVAIVGNCLARLERIGQKADEVNTWVPRYVPEMADAIDRAVSRAKYTYGTWGSDQRLLNATCDFDFRVHV